MKLLLLAVAAWAADPALDRRLLELAAEGRAAAAVLLRNGASADAATESKTTALMLASRNGHRAVVDALLDAGAALDAKDDAGASALLYAASRGRLDCYLALRAKDAARDAVAKDGMTLLHAAASALPRERLEEVLREGGGLEALDGEGLSALDRAVIADRRENAALLARALAGSGLGRAAFVRAAGLGRRELVAGWLASGMSPDAEDAAGLSAWRAAAESAQWPTLELLVDPEALRAARGRGYGPRLAGLLARATRRGELGPKQLEEFELARLRREIDVAAYGAVLEKHRVHAQALRAARGVSEGWLDLESYLAVRRVRVDPELAMTIGASAKTNPIDRDVLEAALKKPVERWQAYAAARQAVTGELDAEAFLKAAPLGELDEALAAGRRRMAWRLKRNKNSDERYKGEAIFAALGVVPLAEAEDFADELVDGWSHDRSAFFAALKAGDSFLEARAAARAVAQGRVDSPNYLRLRRELGSHAQAMRAAERRR